MFDPFNPTEIEEKWWRKRHTTDLYRTVESPDNLKYYCLDFYHYPSGDKLHVGHCRNYLPTDVSMRGKRMQGFNVLHPVGWYVIVAKFSI